jgi:geranylgeranyl diphosphate synthase, type II
MNSFQHYQEILTNEINNLKFEREPRELYEPIEYILNIGGKRLRPVVTLMACDIFGGDIKKAMYPAIGMEMFHNFTLIHDDIMDRAPVRRGFATVHTKWDENRAILSGDAMLILANQFMLKADDDVLREVMELYNLSGLMVCDGQQYDMNYESRNLTSIDEYIRMIELKTAVLISSCFRLGAVIAKTTTQNKDIIEKFGHNLGISFQLEDDILDAFGDYSKFGKSIGGDILANKKTYLLLKAFELAKGKDLDALKNWFEHKDHIPENKVFGVLDIYNRLNIREISKEASRHYFDISIHYLNQLKISDKARSTLFELADFLINRDS